MQKKVLVIQSAALKKGNTAMLADEFIRGAQEAGNICEKIDVAYSSVAGCRGCLYCRKNGSCIIKDDAPAINEKILEADVVVFASPIYFYSWNAQMKAVIDRTFAIESRIKNTDFYLLSACAAPDERFCEVMERSFRTFTGCFRAGGNRICGSVFGVGTGDPGSIAGMDSLVKAYEMGKGINSADGDKIKGFVS